MSHTVKVGLFAAVDVEVSELVLDDSASSARTLPARRAAAARSCAMTASVRILVTRQSVAELNDSEITCRNVAREGERR